MEGKDVSGLDGYDPDTLKQRAAVSAHELGHTYGEEVHREECKGCPNYAQYNIMKNGVNKTTVGLWFAEATKTEIPEWYFNGVDP